MADWIYCGTEPPVNAAGTQSLLRSHRAVWCSPPGLRPWPGIPLAGDRLWLVWRAAVSSPVLLLGGGRLEAASRQLFGTSLLWADPDNPGMRTAAEQLGYGGGNAMSFLRLCNPGFPTGGGQPAIPNIGTIDNRLNAATASQGAILQVTLPIV